MTAVLFVCTGNICRSPTAEAVLRTRATAAGLAEGLIVDSAGTHGYHVGEPPDERAQEAASARGYDLSALRARRVSADDFDRFDHIVAMDAGHLAQLARLAPTGQRHKLALLMDFAPSRAGLNVPDPYYGGHHHFEQVLDLIEAGVDGLLAKLDRA